MLFKLGLSTSGKPLNGENKDGFWQIWVETYWLRQSSFVELIKVNKFISVCGIAVAFEDLKESKLQLSRNSPPVFIIPLHLLY